VLRHQRAGGGLFRTSGAGPRILAAAALGLQPRNGGF
jgi:hypothetical protein